MLFQTSLTRELRLNALCVFIVLLAIIISTQAIHLLGRAANGQIANTALIAVLGFTTLAFLPVLMILTSCSTILVVLTRSWRDHEMVAWLSSGLSLSHWVWPVMRFALPLTALVAGVTLFISPWADQRRQDYIEQIKHREAVASISQGTFIESNSSDKVYFIESYSRTHGAATKIFIQKITDGKVATIFAKEGLITVKPDGERAVVLENGENYAGEPGSTNYEITAFQRYSTHIVETPPTQAPPAKFQGIPTAELMGQDSGASLAELAWRLSMPISCLILSLLAIPLSYFNPRSGQTYNFVLSVLTFLVYQNGLTVARNWVAHGKSGIWLVLFVHMTMLALALTLLSYRNRPTHPIAQAFQLLFRRV